jgi:molecular chaperone GrpE
VAKKEAGENTPARVRRPTSEATPTAEAAPSGGVTSTREKAAPRAVPRKRRAPKKPPKTLQRTVARATEARTRGVDALVGEIRSLKEILNRRFAPPRGGDAALEESVDSLRRLLSELIERRMESVVKELVDIRREAAAAANGAMGRAITRLDALLDDLGAMRFDAEPMDLVDPLIHVVADERHDDTAPDGVILEALQPGYRSARGMVLCKAAVAVNRKS